MFNREDFDDIDILKLREQAHKRQNKNNKKRKLQGKAPIDSFPKQVFSLPTSLKKIYNLKTFIIYDELPQLRKMSVPDLLQYLFRNMLIYECKLIFDLNICSGYEYNYSSVQISLSDYRGIFFNHSHDKIPTDCKKEGNMLIFKFSLQTLRSLNSTYVKIKTNNPKAKARQYILFNFAFIYKALRFDLTANAKDFLLFILERYHWSSTPVIKHRLRSLLKACGISLKQSKSVAIERLNKYFQYLQDWNLLEDTYTFTIEDLETVVPLNMRLLPIAQYD